MTRTRLYEAQLSFNHGLKPRLISALLNRVVRSSIIFNHGLNPCFNPDSSIKFNRRLGGELTNFISH